MPQIFADFQKVSTVFNFRGEGERKKDVEEGWGEGRKRRGECVQLHRGVRKREWGRVEEGWQREGKKRVCGGKREG